MIHKPQFWLLCAMLLVSALGFAWAGYDTVARKQTDHFIKYVAPVVGEVRQDADGDIYGVMWLYDTPDGLSTKVVIRRGFTTQEGAERWVMQAAFRLDPQSPQEAVVSSSGGD